MPNNVVVVMPKRGRGAAVLSLHTVYLSSPLLRRRYCRAVFKEALRLYPPAPPRNTTAPLRLGSVDVPVGTAIHFPIWWVHRHPDNWPHPLQFDPLRFVERVETDSSGDAEGAQEASSSSVVYKDKPVTAGSYLPFSAGPRNCVGQQFAYLEGTIILSVLTAPPPPPHLLHFYGFPFLCPLLTLDPGSDPEFFLSLAPRSPEN